MIYVSDLQAISVFLKGRVWSWVLEHLPSMEPCAWYQSSLCVCCRQGDSTSMMKRSHTDMISRMRTTIYQSKSSWVAFQSCTHSESIMLEWRNLGDRRGNGEAAVLKKVSNFASKLSQLAEDRVFKMYAKFAAGQMPHFVLQHTGR